MKILIFVNFVWFVFAKVEAKSCDDGPTYWCVDLKTARECGAINFCQFENKLIKSDVVRKQQPLSVLDAAPVNVTLYFEALCPDCKQVFLYQIWPAFERLKTSGILNLKFVPYGNAQMRQYGNQWIFYFQHGPSERTGII